MMPIILQHVRELVELHTPEPERDRYKLITPFPPSSPDFPDFDAEALSFGDPPADGTSASLDTVRAYDFFKKTDNLYYDYSYGMKSDEYLLSDVWKTFVLNAQFNTDDVDFASTFAEKKDAFLHKYQRSTAGDLGEYDFSYTSPSPIVWKRLTISSRDVERLKGVAIGLYEDLQDDSGLIQSLIEEIRSYNFSSIQCDLGSFDVIREWMNPHLFEHPGWQFSSGSRTLYGEADSFFKENDVRLCFANRFYVVRDCQGTERVSPPPPVPGHRAILVRDHRRTVRNQLARMKLTQIGRASQLAGVAVAVDPSARATHEWVPPTPMVPGHWQRARIDDGPQPPSNKTALQIAAVSCRVVPANR